MGLSFADIIAVAEDAEEDDVEAKATAGVEPRQRDREGGSRQHGAGSDWNTAYDHLYQQACHAAGSP